MWPTRATTIINNNIGFMPPRIHHHCGGGFGNAFKWMLGFNMAQNMMTSLFSAFKPQSYMQMTPYYNFTSTPYYMPGMTPMQVDTMSTARRTLDSLGFTKESGYSVSMGEDGKLTYTYTDGTTTITASNLKELLNKQAAARQASEEDDNWFVASEGDETVVETDTPESGIIAASALTTPHSNRVSRSPQGWYRSQNAKHETYRFTKEQLTAQPTCELTQAVKFARLSNLINTVSTHCPSGYSSKYFNVPSELSCLTLILVSVTVAMSLSCSLNFTDKSVISSILLTDFK